MKQQQLSNQDLNTLGYCLSTTYNHLVEDKDMLEDKDYQDLISQVKTLMEKLSPCYKVW